MYMSNRIFQNLASKANLNTVVRYNQLRTMATAATVNVTPPANGGFSVSALTKESASKASELLQENHEKHHVFFNKDGFHSKLRLYHK